LTVIWRFPGALRLSPRYAPPPVTQLTADPTGALFLVRGEPPDTRRSIRKEADFRWATARVAPLGPVGSLRLLLLVSPCLFPPHTPDFDHRARALQRKKPEKTLA
jgi:hypothetical protein